LTLFLRTVNADSVTFAVVEVSGAVAGAVASSDMNAGFQTLSGEL